MKIQGVALADTLFRGREAEPRGQCVPRQSLGTRRVLLVMAVVAVFLLVRPVQAQQHYLGKHVDQWQLELRNAPDAPTKRNAAFALGKLGPAAQGAVKQLIACAAAVSEDPGVRETAVYSLGQIVPKGRQDEMVVQLLCNLATSQVDERIKRSAVVALGKFASDTERVRVALDKALRDPDSSVRQNSAWTLGEICQRSGEPPISGLIRALKDSDKLVKRDAALAIGKIIAHQSTGGDDADAADRQRLTKVRDQARDAIAELLNCVKHDYLELKKAACATLINLVNSKDESAMPVLAAACTDADIEVRRNAALALAAIGGEGSAPAVLVLREALRNGDPALRQMAALAFRNIGPEVATALDDLLHALAKDADPMVRYYAAVALGGLKSHTEITVPALVSRVEDRKETMDVRIGAAVSLQTIGLCEEAVNAIPRLLRVLDNPAQPPRVRERVLWALRVHQSDLFKHAEVFEALRKIVVEKGLANSNSGGKMLRYDAAFFLGVFEKSKAPDTVFPVLLDFLKDSTIRIYTGLSFKKGGVGESQTAPVGVGEQGSEDGRINAIQALEGIGPERVKNRPEIIQQLLELRDSNAIVDQKLRDGATRVLKACGVN